MMQFLPITAPFNKMLPMKNNSLLTFGIISGIIFGTKTNIN